MIPEWIWPKNYFRRMLQWGWRGTCWEIPGGYTAVAELEEARLHELREVLDAVAA